MGLQAIEGPYPHRCFTAANGDQLRVVPERGGLVTGWVSGGQERLYFDAERFTDPAKSVRGGIPVLFPICGNLPGNRLDLPQGSYALAQHGFARDLPWQLQPLSDGSGIRLVLESNPQTLAAFPFAFRLSLDYWLEPLALEILATVEHNPGSEGAMPFSLGLHPYFAVSSLKAASLHGLPETCLDHHQMASSSMVEQLAKLPEGVDLLANPTGDAVRLADAGSGQTITLELTAPLDLAVVWTEPPRPMVCLEPWTAPRGSLATGDRCLELEPGQTLQLRCRYVCSGAG
ncbi:galactose mutarotase [Synechococcus sp. W4D4]|uniref:aldose epimerase family protein n=1 Tax=Synechococcus sp. W4D4 TaxID=3392294 RepID=UPI0039E82FDD